MHPTRVSSGQSARLASVDSLRRVALAVNTNERAARSRPMQRRGRPAARRGSGKKSAIGYRSEARDREESLGPALGQGPWREDQSSRDAFAGEACRPGKGVRALDSTRLEEDASAWEEPRLGHVRATKTFLRTAPVLLTD
ncbi:hypothetical protein KM043_003307 [Ampulex compressa]|nr:hypothetical protein KM043_003307 [Ampulex compressa]